MRETERDLKDLSQGTIYSPKIDEGMGLRTIPFVGQEALSPKERVGWSNIPGSRTLMGDENGIKYFVEGDVERPVMQNTAAMPSVTEAQIRHAVAVILDNYWNRSFWTCLLDRKSTYSCPYLSFAQMIYLAYR